MVFFERRKLRKEIKVLLHHARTLRASRGDVMSAQQLDYLGSAVADAQSASRGGDITALRSASGALESCLKNLNPPRFLQSWRDNFDVLVVAIGVAMAFRAYFYQPFKIPTGSMQPTLYGIHCEPRPAAEETVFDRQPLKFFKWLVTGESFQIIRSEARGRLALGMGGSGSKPGYTPVIAGGYAHYVPNEAIELDESNYPVGLKGGLRFGEEVKAGDVIWSGIITAGDFVFVNRWLWNFRHPQRGEVMVFSTHGIQGLQQGTHYIKRMTGLPGETVQVRAPNLVINGKVVTEPAKIAQIASREAYAPWAPPYAGFNPGRGRDCRYLASGNDSIELGPDQYMAMGDNSFNSYDSRYWGPVPERNLLGPASVVYWPFTSPRFGSIH